MSERRIPPVKPYFPSKDIDQLKADLEVILRSGMLTSWTYMKKFEDLYAKSCQVKHAIAVSSGTSALEITLRCLDVKKGDEVLVPTNTFTSTAAAVFFAGAKPVLTDIDSESLCIDVESVQKNITRKTKGIIAVHIGGLVCPEMRILKETCESRGLFLVEDAAHAHGSSIDRQPAGSLGNVGCFSFYPTKVMTTGEGGMITTNIEGVADKARVLRDQGKENFHSSRIVELGYNWRMSEIGAATGLLQLKRLSEMVESRNKLASYYDRELSQVSEIEPLKVPSNIVSNYYKHVAFLDRGIDREAFKAELKKSGVSCGGEVYWPPLHLQPVYKRLLGTKDGDFPVAEGVCSRMVCLPMYTQMTQNEAEYVIEKVRSVLQS
ncbi:MAG: DegT/DnrJ/EryC1/StrS family aminotransferase [Candidatus Bathyarchaeota archaeon]|nr:MAG: DegT/DnrJ/EryC1/StrS family aminotransferase [Candidatus Bathyarchaeota archaeon]